MNVELVPRETPMIGIYKDMLKYTDMHPHKSWNSKPVKLSMLCGFGTYGLVTSWDLIFSTHRGYARMEENLR